MTAIVAPTWVRRRQFADQVLAYEVAIAAEGGDLDSDGKSAWDEVFQSLRLLDIDIVRAWSFGTKVNLPASAGKQLELMGSGADFIHYETDDSELTITPGALALVGDTEGAGYLSCGEAVFDNTSWTVLLCINTASRDASDADENCIPISQYNVGADGECFFQATQHGAVLFSWYGADNVTVQLKAEGNSELRPLYVYAVYNHLTRELKWYDAFTREQLGLTQTGPAGGWLDLPMELGRPSSHPWAPRVFHSSGIIKLDGAQTTDTLEDLTPILIDGLLGKFVENLAIFTNSVGAAFGASPITNGYTQQLRVLGVTSNIFVWMRPNLGAKDIWDQALMDYEVPVGRQATIGTIRTPRNEDVSATYYLDKHITMVLFTEDQNFGLGLTIGSPEYSDYCHVADSICDALREVVPDLVRIQGTPIAHLAVDFVTHLPLSYATMRDSAYYEARRQFAISMRVDDRYDAVPDIYYTFNLGREAVEDGTPVNRYTDVANGNPAYFPSGGSVDPQHPNNTGHAAYLATVQTPVLALRRYY